jgi:hypothetical protein
MVGEPGACAREEEAAAAAPTAMKERRFIKNLLSG